MTKNDDVRFMSKKEVVINYLDSILFKIAFASFVVNAKDFFVLAADIWTWIMISAIGMYYILRDFQKWNKKLEEWERFN